MANPSTSLFLNQSACDPAAPRAFKFKSLDQAITEYPCIQDEKTTLDREEIEGFAQAGLAHLMAISGLHIGLLMLLFRFFFYGLLRLLQKEICI